MADDARDVLRVLVVDDDEVDRQQVRRLLQRGHRSWQIVEAFGALHAREKLAEEPVDVVLVDYLLPGEDGLSLLASLPHGSAPPVVVLTGQADAELAVSFMKAGASDFLVKADMAVERLETTLDNAIVADRRRRQAERAEAALRRSLEQTKAMGHLARNLLVGDSARVLPMALRPFLRALAADRLVVAHSVRIEGRLCWQPIAQVTSDRLNELDAAAVPWADGWRSWQVELGAGTSVRSIAADDATGLALTDQGVSAAVAAPFYVDGRSYGFIRADWADVPTDTIGNDTPLLLQSVGDLLGSWLERNPLDD